jgi:hypothetical protein
MGEILHHYTEMITDPAHTLVELTFILVVDVIFLGLLWPLAKRAVNKRVNAEHKVLDQEHGIKHD